MRPLILKVEKMFPLCYSRVAHEIKNRFPYAFDVRYPGAPAFELHEIENKPFQVLDTEITPIEVIHFKITVLDISLKIWLILQMQALFLKRKRKTEKSGCADFKLYQEI
jgi:phosphoribosyl 1,2-cyclic phosphate phosphodiesterase